MSQAQIFRLFSFLAFGFSVLNGVLGAIAPIYHPSWGNIVGICFGFWMLFTTEGSQRWLGILVVADIGLGALAFYAFGITNERREDFILATCWLVLGVYFFKQSLGTTDVTRQE